MPWEQEQGRSSLVIEQVCDYLIIGKLDPDANDNVW